MRVQVVIHGRLAAGEMMIDAVENVVESRNCSSDSVATDLWRGSTLRFGATSMFR